MAVRRVSLLHPDLLSTQLVELHTTSSPIEINQSIFREPSSSPQTGSQWPQSTHSRGTIHPPSPPLPPHTQTAMAMAMDDLSSFPHLVSRPIRLQLDCQRIPLPPSGREFLPLEQTPVSPILSRMTSLPTLLLLLCCPRSRIRASGRRTSLKEGTRVG